MDGFPRTVAQAEGVRRDARAARGCRSTRSCSSTPIARRLVSRLSARWSNPRNGRTYNTMTNPPKRAGIDDDDGGPLIQRVDDQPETVAKRLDVYDAQTRPLIDYYRKTGKLVGGRRAAQRVGRRAAPKINCVLSRARLTGGRARRDDAMIALKSAREIEIMRRSGKITASVLTTLMQCGSIPE